MVEFDLIHFLIIINISFFVLLFILFLYIFIQKYMAKIKKERETRNFKIWEDDILLLIVSNDETAIKKTIQTLQPQDYESFMDFISTYLSNIADDSLEIFIKIIKQERLLHKIHKYASTSDLSLKIYFIYFMGLLKISDNTMCEKNLAGDPEFECQHCVYKDFNTRCYQNALNDPNPLIRIVTIQMIARTKRFEQIESVLNLLVTEKIFNLYKIIEILFEFTSESAPYFYKILKNQIFKIKDDKNKQIVAICMELLGIWKYLESAEEILEILKKEKDDSLIKSCINALGKMKYQKAAEHILINLESRSYEVKISCMKALFAMNYAELTQILKKHLNDPMWEIRYVASNLLFELGYNLQEYLFDTTKVDTDTSNAYRTIVHVLTEKTIIAMSNS